MKQLLTAMALILAAPAAQAQELMGSYSAYIGSNDVYNSSGARLTKHWQVLRQDRANFHRYGIKDRDDEWDQFFDDSGRRGQLEALVKEGNVPKWVAQAIVAGEIHVYVEIWGQGGFPYYVTVQVAG